MARGQQPRGSRGPDGFPMFRPPLSSVPANGLLNGLLKAAIGAGRNLLGRIPKRWLGHPGFGIDSARRPLLLLVLAAAIPILLFGFWASYLSAEKRRSEIRRDALERVAEVAARVSGELHNNMEALQGLAVSSA